VNLSVSGGITALAALDAMFNGGNLGIFTGGIPSAPSVNSTGTLLVEFAFSGLAFNAPTQGGGSSTGLVTATATFTNPSVSPSASGLAGYARAFASGVATSASGIADFTVGASGSVDVLLGSTTISMGVPVDMTSFTQSLPVL
jgi:hypothetical protein